MRRRCLPALIGVVGIVAMPAVVVAQTHSARTAWGDPDMQGTWTNTTTTPLERPEDLADKAVLTPEEFAARNAQVAEEANLDNRPRTETGAYNEFWMERGVLNLRTSLIIDPADGQLPPLTPTEARRRADHAADRTAHWTDSYENRSAYDRCISRGERWTPKFGQLAKVGSRQGEGVWHAPEETELSR